MIFHRVAGLKKNNWMRGISAAVVMTFALVPSFSFSTDARSSPAPISMLEYFANSKREMRNLDVLRDYAMELYRLPAGHKISPVICLKKGRCQTKKKGNYEFYALSPTNQEMEDYLVEMKFYTLQQYRVTGFYEFTKDKYFTVSFAKSGIIPAGMLMEDINFAIRPTTISASGKIEFDSFANFKYYLLGGGQASDPTLRLSKFRSFVDQDHAFMLISESDAQKNDPVYVAIIKRCDKMQVPTFDIQMMEKDL